MGWEGGSDYSSGDNQQILKDHGLRDMVSGNENEGSTSMDGRAPMCIVRDRTGELGASKDLF